MEKTKILMIVGIAGLAYYLYSQSSNESQTTQTQIPKSVLIDNDPYLTPHFHTINF
jgi:hypothetical protein